MFAAFCRGKKNFSMSGSVPWIERLLKLARVISVLCTVPGTFPTSVLPRLRMNVVDHGAKVFRLQSRGRVVRKR
jgi:hypothetical protein